MACILASEALSGCGSIIHPYSYSSLNGGWMLSGSRAMNLYPLLSASLVVDGDQVTAVGDESVQCTNQPIPIEGGFQLTGRIASDGSFHLTDIGSSNSLQIAIDGKVPVPGETGWNGSYSITDLPGFAPCTISEAAPLTALPLAPINGIYSGALSGTLGQGNVQVSASLSEGPPSIVAQPGGGEIGYLPVTGSISVSGSACFTSGTAVESTDNLAEGDLLLLLSLSMNNGSQAALTALYAAPDGRILQNVVIEAIGGQCNGQEFAGTLTRQ